jgi:hypothetical protein
MSRHLRYGWAALAAAIACTVGAGNGRGGETAADTPPAVADGEKYALIYRFQPGEVVRWQVVHQATVRTTFQGQSQTARTRSESIKVWTVNDVSDDGQVELVYTVERVKMINQMPNRASIEYDSQADAEVPAGFEQIAETIGVPLAVLRLSPQGKLLSREDKRAGGPSAPDMPITTPLPAEPVAVGDSWTEPYELTVPLPSGGTRQVSTRRRFELAEVRDGVATIGCEYQVLTPINDPALEAQLVQRLATGTVRFDIRTGRVLSDDSRVDKRVLGFSGPATAIHHVIRRTETLITRGREDVAERPDERG